MKMAIQLILIYNLPKIKCVPKIKCESFLCMCHNLETCDATVSLTGASCLYPKNVVEHDLSILKILSK